MGEGKASSNEKRSSSSSAMHSTQVMYRVILKKVLFCVFSIIKVWKGEKNFTIQAKINPMHKSLMADIGQNSNVTLFSFQLKSTYEVNEIVLQENATWNGTH